MIVHTHMYDKAPCPRPDYAHGERGIDAYDDTLEQLDEYYEMVEEMMDERGVVHRSLSDEELEM